MCWTTYKEELAKTRTADKDIKAFKVCRPTDDPNYAKPYYFNHYGDYKVGNTYFICADIFVRQIRPPHLHTCYEIDRGYHSYNPEKVSVSIDENPMDDAITLLRNDVKTPLHSYSVTRNDNGVKIDYFLLKRNLVKVNCTIPKGATYYENENGEFVSDIIRIDSMEDL